MFMCSSLVLEGIEAGGVVANLLLLAKSLGGSLGRGETTALRAGEVGAEIQGGTESTLLLDLEDVLAENLVVNSVDLGDGLADGVDLANLVSGTSGHLSDAKLRQLGLEGVQLLEQLALGLLAERLRLERSGYTFHFIASHA